MPQRHASDRENRPRRDVHIYKKYYGHRGFGGGVYFLGLIGALFYYLQHAVTSSDIILGILKAIVWPAMVVYHVLGL